LSVGVRVPPPASVSKAYLSICTIYRDEAPYLREWIEFHRLVGVERFFLYDHDSIDDHLSVLEPYIAEGIVTRHEWPFPRGQSEAFERCVEEHGNDSRWIAFTDVDEFLFSPTLRPVSELLVDYEQWPGIGVNWAVFGTSGHRTRPAGLVIENYVHRTEDPRSNSHIKSIVDPSRVASSPSAHFFKYRDGLAVDENKRPLEESPFSEQVSFERLRINHYYTKSEEEAAKKFSGSTTDPSRRPRIFPLRPSRVLPRLDRRMSQVRDETILGYVPALREAVATAEKRGLGGGEQTKPVSGRGAADARTASS
jgi:hypothetical protein